MDLLLKKTFDYSRIELLSADHTIGVITATSEYIPINDFKEAFNHITALTKEEGITKLIFDKRNLRVFHQPSMEWYFIEWKEKVYDLGLRTHRKILPDDPIFRQSVKLGREKIAEKFPNGKYKLMDIQYAENLDSAIEN
jgi:hypothetical protein